MSDAIKDMLAAANRRSFVKNLGLASAAAGIVGSASLAEAQTTGPTDVDILNFALNLEYLEAEFYTAATSGLTISAFEVATGSSAGATLGGARVPWMSNNLYRLALELSADERTHVSLLQGAITSLGGTAISKPAITFPAGTFASETSFLIQARVFEEIGVTAYGAAAPLISSKSILGYAARILAAEAEHVGFIRSVIGDRNIVTTALDTVDILPPPSGAQYFSLDTNGLSGVRSPGQVLFLAFGGTASATTGGFFPNGVNGSNSALQAASASAATSDSTFFITNNPIPVSTLVGGYGSAQFSWAAPSGVTQVSIRLGSPSGTYFIYGGPTGTMATPNWVEDGMVFYLQDASNLATEQTAAKTLGIVIAHLGS